MARQQFQMANQSIRPSDDPTYKQSRAAQRQMYGTRRIDARAKQSAQDTTPSGRATRMKEEGMTPDEIAREQNNLWRDRFGPQMRPEDFLAEPQVRKINLIEGLPRFTPDPAINQPQPLQPTRFATADDILDAYQSGAVSGSFQTPYGPASFGVTPQSTIPASAMSEFLPTQPRGYMSSVLGNASKWSKPLTRYG